ncbi:hypothetical protein AVEN_151663-1 [Araneus ventricosus]|uniref:Uncharacterized protein n=1 Tax=Araneus ventricosus TaxID=182803 RepID=A0A4Y2JTQ3_ARAVE|nr:hypothetical protein AVEN_151663-1 [Araneus ventricosus]
MSSPDYSELMPLDKFSRIDSAIKSTKNHINWLELDRVAAILKTLKDDEVRLTKCIDDIELFHRDMFVLPNKENKPADAENETAMKDDMNETEYSVTEPECSGNEPMHSMNEPDFSMNEQNSSRRRLILKFPKSCTNNMYSESDHSYVSSLIKIDSGGDMDELVDIMDGLFDAMDESVDVMDESGDGMDESSDGMKESSDGMKESSDGKEEPSDDENEMAKKVLLNVLTDKEKEITELVLHLIYTFSCFQRRLRKAETSASLSSRIIPGKSRFKVKRTLNSLSGTVLHLDKTASKIYAKYSEMLQSLGKIFE